MEMLKSIVPTTLKHIIEQSTLENLQSTCSSLLQFFLQSHHFHELIADLVDNNLCSKNKDAALDFKRKGNQCFVNGDFARASKLYTQKMDLLLECLRDCNRALWISPNYAKVWYRRGQSNASLGYYEDAAQDLSVSMNLELSLSGKKQVERELLPILDKCKSTSRSVDQHSGEEAVIIRELPQIKLQCVSSQMKGRGMTSADDIPSASLIHTEEPYAAIISKHCRENYCHFCFDELPADTVPCTSCSIALYCSERCRIQAGHVLKNYPENFGLHGVLSSELEQYAIQSIAAKDSDLNLESIPEHKHECQGVNWPAILPTEIVLSGRVLAKSMEQRKGSTKDFNSLGTSELCQNYVQMLPDDKLELHIYSVVLLNCLHKSYGSELLISGASISKLVILISQIKVNSMAIVRMKFNDDGGPLDQSGIPGMTGDPSTGKALQVRVGQAIYLSGSMFNHSCQPNIHVYFLKRSLFIRATEFVAVGYPLELSYGPQVGQWDCKDRQRFLQDQYSFKCQCIGCSNLNLSDLVLNAFRCVDLNCFGVVLDKENVQYLQGAARRWSSELYPQVDEGKDDNTKKVASHMVEKTNGSVHIRPEYCLNCGAFRDLKSAYATVEEAGIYISRLQDEIDSRNVSATTISDALRSLHILRSTLHTYNKGIAEMDDNFAHAFCLVGEFQLAVDHCKASIAILEKLYGPTHIAVGHELLKLSTIQLSMGDFAAVDSINRLGGIFSQYYGSDTAIIFPHLQSLQREAHKLVR